VNALSTRSSRCSNPGAVVQRGTTQRQTEQKTELTIHYEFHPWAGESVQLVKRINRGSEPIYRVERMSSGKLRRIDIPCWMFDRASCVALVTKDEPLACIEHLAQLRRLLASIGNPASQNDLENEHSPLPSQGNAHEKQNQKNSQPRTT
jgi:hypothetical protein